MAGTDVMERADSATERVNSIFESFFPRVGSDLSKDEHVVADVERVGANLESDKDFTHRKYAMDAVRQIKDIRVRHDEYRRQFEALKRVHAEIRKDIAQMRRAAAVGYQTLLAEVEQGRMADCNYGALESLGPVPTPPPSRFEDDNDVSSDNDDDNAGGDCGK